jgi:hypothetical protein
MRDFINRHRLSPSRSPRKQRHQKKQQKNRSGRRLQNFQVIASADVKHRTVNPGSCHTQDYVPAEFKVPFYSGRSAAKNVSHFNVHWT